MKGCLLGYSAFHYLVSIDDYYVAVWAADSRDGVPELVQAMLHGGIVCFGFKSSDKQSVIDFMVSEDNRLIANGSMGNGNLIPSVYRGYSGRKRFFDLYEPQCQEDACQ
ncbi:hypothetical protein [Citrobacter sp. JL978]|uniref:hypothetical protein n=1 Tax=Citrobacter sp. JL978 TaxID=2652398 RepID=UPI0012D99879|nr:hypothetical protein [Citrobacter sp. JL978]MTZ83903.1 hypothetical protein [Citrobacter sp. JL978]